MIVLGRGLGSTASDVAVGIATVVTDPALPQVLSLLKQIKDTVPPSTSSGLPTPGPSAPGVGLIRAVTPLKIILYSRQHAWFVPTAVAGIFGLPILLGFVMGRASKRKS